MRFGVCTWTFGDMPLPQLAGRLAALGLDGVELFGDLSVDPGEARRVLADHGLVALSVTPDDVDLAHPDAEVRGRALDYYLRLVDWAADLGAPLISCHGAVGRVRALSDQQREWDLLVHGVLALSERARGVGLKVAMELLNRYESHLLNSTEQGLRFLSEVDRPGIGLLLDAYHMNIEEPDPAAAVREAAEHLMLLHVADSNRQAVGRGHTDFAAIAAALGDIDYGGDVVFECVAPGPDPFTWDRGPGTHDVLEGFLSESLRRMRA